MVIATYNHQIQLFPIYGKSHFWSLLTKIQLMAYIYLPKHHVPSLLHHLESRTKRSHRQVASFIVPHQPALLIVALPVASRDFTRLWMNHWSEVGHTCIQFNSIDCLANCCPQPQFFPMHITFGWSSNSPCNSRVGAEKFLNFPTTCSMEGTSYQPTRIPWVTFLAT